MDPERSVLHRGQTRYVRVLDRDTGSLELADRRANGVDYSPQPRMLYRSSLTFDLLSVQNGLHVVWLLAADELDVTTMVAANGATSPATSLQQTKLRAAGVVRAYRDGRRQLYRVDDPTIVGVIALMFERIAPDGTLAGVADQLRPPRRPRFAVSAR